MYQTIIYKEINSVVKRLRKRMTVDCNILTNISTLCFSDLAARNCLLMGDQSVKIGDYGTSDVVFKVGFSIC